MKNTHLHESPFKTLISFHKVIDSLKVIAESSVDYRSNYAKALLAEMATKPEFVSGMEDFRLIEENADLIKNLLADLFPTALTHNEIKAATLPFYNISFNYSERFKKILKAAGRTFDVHIRDIDAHQFYVLNCILILNAHYHQELDFVKPLFYDIPDKNGIMRHYRILYNADFVEIYPSENARIISEDEIVELLDNYDNLALWKQKFPPESWVMKGFVIASLVDVTVENAVSNLKTFLLRPEIGGGVRTMDASSIFKSVFKIPDLRTGFTMYNQEDDTFQKPTSKQGKLSSFILNDKGDAGCKNTLCDLYDTLIKEQKVLILSDVNQFATGRDSHSFAARLLQQNVQSCLFAPLVNNGKLLGIIELASAKPRALHSINATKLDLIMPFLVDTIVRFFSDMENKLEAVIQNEYTTIHPSVYWKFKQEARHYVQHISASKDYLLKEIVFRNVYPLYGQIDIQSSAAYRNETVRTDLRNQLSAILELFDALKPKLNLAILEQRKFELRELLSEVESPIKTDTEQQIQHFIELEIHPILNSVKADKSHAQRLKDYFDQLDPKIGMFYHARKGFDQTLSVINKKLATVLDARQVEAQQIYPHYYERFKTDGVEHNLYIGASIVPNVPYDKMYLHNLRLWQLQTLCEMEFEHHQIKESLPYGLDVTALILVFSTPIAIRFRMDEKRFDVDGSYNARYEVVKKRIDKAHIKGTGERITEKEKITIVYSHNTEETEYLKYIKYLQFKNVLEEDLERFEVEDLQGVSGLKALRVKVSHTNVPAKKYSYQDLLNELN